MNAPLLEKAMLDLFQKLATEGFPVAVSTTSLRDDQGGLIYPDNYPQSFTYGEDGLLSTLSFTNGVNTWTQTLTYTDGVVSTISQWVKS